MAGESADGDNGEACAVAHYTEDLLTWKSETCDQVKEYICMGEAGSVFTDQCKKIKL